MGLEYRSSTGLGETETPLSEGAHQVSCALGSRTKKPGPDLLGGLGGSPGEVEVGSGSQWWQGQQR